MTSFYHICISVGTHSSTIEPRGKPLTFVPSSIFESLPKHNPSPSSKRQNTLPDSKRKDYRYGPIVIDWIDVEVQSMEDSVPGPSRNQPQMDERNHPTAVFEPVITQQYGTANLPEGIVRIFRERPLSSSETGQPSTSNAASSSSANPTITDSPECTIVAVLAVPPWMTPSDFLAFVSPTVENIKHLRLIRDVSPNRTMVVIQFRDEDSAVEFFEAFNGKQFNSIEPETCNVVRVRSVVIDAQDPVTMSLGRSFSTPPASFELPTCPVCLDRMDTSVTGLITVPCSHTFHCMCLSKWGDSRCPVCRYSQIALSTSPTSNLPAGLSYAPPPEGARLASCVDCNSSVNLWICLICGNVGCGRQGRAHAKGHYDLTSHQYAMDLQTQRVWDYHGDNYVHRLIQNKADGKLVELPSAAGVDEAAARRRAGEGPGEDDNMKAEKMEILAMQYSQILQRSMEEQRSNYDEQTRDLRRRLEDAQRKLEIMGSDAESKARDLREDLARYRAEEESRRSNLEKEKLKAEKRAEKMADLARKLERDLKEERTVSEGLLNNLALSKDKIDAVEKEKGDLHSRVVDLEEQMRDLMFFLEARDKIEQNGGAAAEAAGGTVELPPQPPNRIGGGSKKKKKK